jgi:hypothetical protein
MPLKMSDLGFDAASEHGPEDRRVQGLIQPMKYRRARDTLFACGFDTCLFALLGYFGGAYYDILTECQKLPTRSLVQAKSARDERDQQF